MKIVKYKSEPYLLNRTLGRGRGQQLPQDERNHLATTSDSIAHDSVLRGGRQQRLHPHAHRRLGRSTPRTGVNFINISHAPFLFESTAFLQLQRGFIVFWRKNIGAKAALKMLMKLTTTISSTFYKQLLR